MAARSKKDGVPKRPRRYGGEYAGYVQKVYGDGPFAVEYSVLDSQGYTRKAKMPHSPKSISGGWAGLLHVRRFKTLRGAVGFFLKKCDAGALPQVYQWRSRAATPLPEPDASGRYEGGVRIYAKDDLWQLERKNPRWTIEDVMADVEKTIVRGKVR